MHHLVLLVFRPFFYLFKYVFLFGSQPSHSTIEDIYTAVIETDRGVKEKVRIFDTGAAAMVRFARWHS